MLAEAANAAQTTRDEVIAALRRASAATGSDFSYLLGTAMRESSLKPEAKSTSSSAAGLFQFVSQTWLGMVKQFGVKHGLGSYAAAIQKGADGRYHADNAADRQAILALRNDPTVSALMAGEYANQTKQELESRLGRDVCGGELYAAHFLGPGAACRLIEMNGHQPSANAAAAFPAAARANRSVFYHANGTPKTVREVYDWTLKQPAVSSATLAKAEAQPAPPAVTAFSAPVVPLSVAASETGQSAPPSPSAANSWSTLSLFTSSSPSVGPLISTAALPTAPFVLTPGVVRLLASMTPDGASQRDETDKAV